MTATQTARRCKAVLANHYGAKLEGVVLFGSAARRQSGPGSDIDMLVLLNHPFDYFSEMRQIIDLLYPVQLSTDRLLSVKPAAVEDFRNGRIQLYRNAKREGLIL